MTKVLLKDTLCEGVTWVEPVALQGGPTLHHLANQQHEDIQNSHGKCLENATDPLGTKEVHINVLER